MITREMRESEKKNERKVGTSVKDERII